MKIPKELLKIKDFDCSGTLLDMRQRNAKTDILDNFFYYQIYFDNRLCLDTVLDDKIIKYHPNKDRLKTVSEISKVLIASGSPENRKRESKIRREKTEVAKTYHNLGFDRAMELLEKQWIEKEPILYSRFIADTGFTSFSDIDNYIIDEDNKEKYKIKADIFDHNKIWNIGDFKKYQIISILVNFSIEREILDISGDIAVDDFDKSETKVYYLEKIYEDKYKELIKRILEIKDAEKFIKDNQLSSIDYTNLSNSKKIDYLVGILNKSFNRTDILVYNIDRIIGYDSSIKVKGSNMRYGSIRGIKFREYVPYKYDVPYRYINENKEYSMKDLLELIIIGQLELLYYMYVIDKKDKYPDILEYINNLNQFLCSAKLDLIYE